MLKSRSEGRESNSACMVNHQLEKQHFGDSAKHSLLEDSD